VVFEKMPPPLYVKIELVPTQPLPIKQSKIAAKARGHNMLCSAQDGGLIGE
jgi:hypothetical protein